MSATPQWVDLDLDELNAALARAKPLLEEADYDQLSLSVAGFAQLLQIIDNQRLSLKRLRHMLFGAPSEKSRKVLGKPSDSGDRNNGSRKKNKPPPSGHGRNAAADYTGGERVTLDHPSLNAGQRCPDCELGKLCAQREPGSLVRIVGQAPLGATVYELEKLRCNLCGEVFTAPPPEDLSPNKYDESAATMISALKYGSGFPFNRLDRLQHDFGIPLPASTQWDIVERAAGKLVPVHHELIRQAAQGELIHNDDTNMRVLELMDPETRQMVFADLAPERCGVFTSGIVSVHEQRTIVLFFTGAKHAGENLAHVLQQRALDLAPPIQMCDGLSRNLAPTFQTILANCNAHGRRKFVEVANNFPVECRYVLDTLGDVYKLDAVAKMDELSPEQRLTFHQLHSAPLMSKLHAWMKKQKEEKLVEPNSGLGQAIDYMTNHWAKLTLFLHVPGAPLDNNVCERALKKAILHRKSSMFFKTINGARVGDMFMSFIHTCQLGGVNPFHYLTELQKHAHDIAVEPGDWMPWNYRDTLARAGPP